MSPTIQTQMGAPERDERDHHFRTDHLKANLAARSAKGGVVTLAAQVCKFLLSMVAAVVLARLLTPRDYGLIGMVTILVGFLGMFQYLGLSTATVKWSELSHEQVSTLFWINVALSVTIMLVTIAAAPVAAWFYKEPRLLGITLAYSVTIVLTGLSIQHEAILVRQMRFTATAVIEISSMLIGLIVAIIAAWLGARYWALIINQGVNAIVMIIGMWTACRWRPSWPARGAPVRSMVSYGGNLTGYNIMSYFSRNVDNLLIGKFWGAYQLGVYSRAYQMLLMPMQQINAPLVTVAIPALSRLTDSPTRYRAAFLRIVEKVAMITMPGVAFMIGSSDWIVVFLLGPQWHEASRIFMLLGIAAIVQPVARCALWLFLTHGRAREMFHWGVISGVIAVVSIVVGLPWGATGVALSYAATDLCVSTPLLFWYVSRNSPVQARDFYRTIAPALCASLSALALLFAARPWLELFPHLLSRLSLAAAITAVVSLAVFTAIPAGRMAMLGFKEMLMHVIRSKRESVV